MALVVAVGLACGAGTVHADITFGEPVLFDEPVNSPGLDYFDCISADGLELYIERPIGGVITSANWDLYVSTRETTGGPWSVPVSLGPTVNSAYSDAFACLSGDGLELYLASNRPGGHGGRDLWVATRPTRSDPWATPVNLGPTINTAGLDTTPWVTPDGLGLYFSSDRPGGYGRVDIWMATRVTTNDPWGEPANLGPPVNSEAGDYFPCLSSDGLVLFFSDYDNPNSGLRPGGHGLSDMWMTRRKSTADPWGPPVGLGKGMNTDCWETQARLSPDGSVLYFTSSRPDKTQQIANIWQARILPIVDFNGDGKVDGAEVRAMANRWGTDDSLCDIAPTAWGDGVVSVEDLKVLAEYIGKDVVDNTLIAHWALDEADGDVAYDSTLENDAVVVGGGVAWQPEGGVIGGALAFDGIDAYIETPPVVNPRGGVFLNPADGPFSVVAWVKSEVPGQVVFSQSGGDDWLLTDASGALLTDLKGSARNAASLHSQTVITDGQWHRIGLTWDDRRTLYVDDVAVAEDEPGPPRDIWVGFHIGAGANLEPDTFFTGLIDDVRIYNRAVRP